LTVLRPDRVDVVVGGDQDGAHWVAEIINIDPPWQDSSKNAWYRKMISDHFRKERRDGWIRVWF
jgi:hypothetical protein